MQNILVIVPCGQAKIWDDDPQHGPSWAHDAYTGSPFKVNRAYAERFATQWVILSAKYGFIAPDFMLPGPYNVTFKRPATAPVALASLRHQVQSQQLDRFETIIGLGGKDYRRAITAAFAGLPVTLLFPFAGLGLGLGMQQVKRAITLNKPHAEELATRQDDSTARETRSH